MIRTFSAAALFAIAAIPAAHAADPVPKEIVVSYRDLDLGTASGQSELKARVREAAATLCSPVLAIPPDSEPAVAFHMSVYRGCVGRLSERALAKVKTGSN